ncbi:zinc finger protein 653 isoform X2 [Gouania willdenowi]|uniref:zinc finger protein 653 isoform X2 n=1 Tax=Gouania willdenowi TaxID=441366 RepID=UPI00105683D2|nr:zinc finger protein 653 isoform X2 [Gouania willdenowi]
MADILTEPRLYVGSNPTGDQEQDSARRCRGRPRLNDSDRAQRRLESRKKYDVRRVYLGESHRLWSELRRRTSLSDAGLAEYLILLHSTYGHKHRKDCGKDNVPERSVTQKRGRSGQVSSLQSLVCWYQEHTRSCPHEPQLRALEPQSDFSTAAVWQCDANHSFMQYLFSPLRGANDSGHNEEVNRQEETTTTTETPVLRRKRRKETRRRFKDVEEDGVSVIQHANNGAAEATSLNQQVTHEVHTEAPPTAQPVWDMDQAQDSIMEEFHSVPEVEEEELEAEDQPDSNGESEENLRSIHHGCVITTTSLSGDLEKTADDAELSQSLSALVPLSDRPLMLVPPTLEVQEQSELFHHQTLHAVVTGCETPDQKTALEGSQLIIITGPSYEALTSDGIQLNMGAGDVEEVTCTVIGGVTYNQVCASASRTHTEDEDSMSGLAEKQLLQPSVNHMELSSERELQRSLSSVRSKRSRRGPVIEADGMLKMFHCPYEGCSQVYVAISSFQESETSSVRHVASLLNVKITWRFTGEPTLEKPLCNVRSVVTSVASVRP